MGRNLKIMKEQSKEQLTSYFSNIKENEQAKNLIREINKD